MSFSVSLYNLLSWLKMSAYHLRKDEVKYELKIRGLSTEGNANELRKIFSQCCADNVPVDQALVNSLDTDQELNECEGKFSDLSILAREYEGNYQDNEYNRIIARLHHLSMRIERIPIAPSLDLEPAQLKEELVKKIKEVLNSFLNKSLDVEVSRRLSEDNETSATIDGQPTGLDLQRKNEDTEELAAEEVIITTSRPKPLVTATAGVSSMNAGGMDSSHSQGHRQDHSCPPSRLSVPVYKWGIHFDAESGQSVGAFLQRVEELRRARRVTTDDLFESAVDLFSGQALVWYRSVQSRVGSWGELCQEMRLVFQTPDYDFRLQREIQNRIQGDFESVDMFLASMEGLYNRLSTPVPEATRLLQILNNVNPHLQDRLSLLDIKTVEDLRMMGRRAEAGRFRASIQRPVPRSYPHLEPDLAYSESTRKKGVSLAKVATVSKMQSGASSSIKCWNCGSLGHRYNTCSKERKRFCYGCGLPDTFKSKCGKCSPKNV